MQNEQFFSYIISRTLVTPFSEMMMMSALYNMFYWIFIMLTRVSRLVLSAVDQEFEPGLDQTKDYEIDICCISAKHTALRSMNKDWLVRNQNNWIDHLT
jgi:hypothetical protein